MCVCTCGVVQGQVGTSVYLGPREIHPKMKIVRVNIHCRVPTRACIDTYFVIII
jgi:hypothetical protein